MTRASLLLSLALLTAVPALAAPPIYRCGDDGRTYSQVPCPEGSLIEASDPRTAAQRAEAKRLVEAERRRAAEQERERKAAAEKAAEKPVDKPAPGTAAAASPAAAEPIAPVAGKPRAAKTPADAKDVIAAAPKAATAPR